MKIAVMGGAGLMADTIIKDLLESPGVDEILIADYLGDKATQKAASFNDTRVKGCFVDGFDIETTAELLKSYDSLINAAQLYPNPFRNSGTTIRFFVWRGRVFQNHKLKNEN